MLLNDFCSFGNVSCASKFFCNILEVIPHKITVREYRRIMEGKEGAHSMPAKEEAFEGS